MVSWVFNWYKTTQKDANTWSEILNIDHGNNIYSGTQFGDSLFIGDTVLTHSSYYDWGNWAIAKYNNDGKFQSVFGITSTNFNNIYDVVLETDENHNIYLACQYSYLATFLDTTIYTGNDSLLGSPDLFIAKLSPSLQIEWIRQIHSPSQDVCNDISISANGFIYIPVKHYGNGYELKEVNYFNQDTANYYNSLCSVLKMDTNGNLVWRREIRTTRPGISLSEINFDNQENIVLDGMSYDNLYCFNDSVIHPNSGDSRRLPFILRINPDGSLINGNILGWDMYFSDTEIDESGNFYISGVIWDTIVFGSDTINKHEDSTVNIIAKLTPGFEPLWYQKTKVLSSQGSYNFHIDLLDDSLFFAVSCRGYFSIFDTTINIGATKKVFVGQTTPTGELTYFDLIETTNGLNAYDFKFDNCENIIVSGNFVGSLYTFADTIQANSISAFDGILVKVNRNTHELFSLGNDTTVCNGFNLQGPIGFKNYYWNDSLTMERVFEINNSGLYTLSASTESGCWVYDTIEIIVQPGFDIDIGVDTVINMFDSISFLVEGDYDSIIWSTGSTENVTTVFGYDFGGGEWTVWVEAFKGVCSANDSVFIEVIDDIFERSKYGVSVFPNPVGDLLNISTNNDLKGFEIIEISGNVLIAEDKSTFKKQEVTINVGTLNKGVYLLRIYTSKSVQIAQFVKL